MTHPFSGRWPPVAIAILGGALALLLLAPAGETAGIEEHRVKAAVRAYCRALPRAYETRRPELLAEAATPSEVTRVDTIAFGLSQRGLILESRLEADRFDALRVDGNRAEVETTEEWWFRHLDAQSREPRGDVSRVRYAVRYELVREVNAPQGPAPKPDYDSPAPAGSPGADSPPGGDDRWRVDRVQLSRSEPLR